MKTGSLLLLAFIGLFTIQLNADKPNSRAKRFAAFGSLSTVGGRVGCVVSQNKLFINGHFTKDLSEDEQQELQEYQDKLNQFKQEVRAYLEQRQAQFQQQANGGGGGSAAEVQPKAPKKPEPPKKPSFCSDKATTQYVFDGCSIQGDNVYIADTFVRKLSAEEQQELEQFDKQFTAYQKAITADFSKKVKAAFGEHFGSLFGLNSAGGAQPSGNASAGSQSAEQENGAGSSPPSAGGNSTQPEAPKTPSFCTLIV